jgi:hypothetical protein
MVRTSAFALYTSRDWLLVQTNPIGARAVAPNKTRTTKVRGPDSDPRFWPNIQD